MSEGRRRWAKHALAAIAALLFLEASAYAIYWVRYGEPMSFSDLAATRAALASGETIEGELPRADREDTHVKWAVHPYVGYVVDPNRETWLSQDATHVYSSSGEPVEVPPQPREGRVIVGLFGGSVAFQFGNDAQEAVLRGLRTAFPSREIVVVVAAQPSWKQPQCLFALQWLTLRGYCFDQIIELDGFNETMGGYANHAWYGTNVAYPFNFRALMASSHEGPEYLAAAGEMRLVQRARRDSASWLDGTPLAYSPTANLVWWTIDQGRQSHAEELRNALRSFVSSDTRHYAQRGPSDDLGDVESDDAPLVDATVQTWVDANRQMARLAHREGAELLLALQPNQYLHGSKPLMSERERRERAPSQSFDARVNVAYPRLRELGPRLAEEEHIRWVDLTQIFVETREETYADRCCHLNERGNAIMAQAIGAALAPAQSPVSP